MANFFDQFDSAPSPVGDDLSPFASAISKIESGGNYRAVGPATRDGDRALGRYQVMSKNVGPWSKEILGQEITPQQFISSPEIQDKIFQGKFGGYVKKYGPEGAARAWFAGEGGMNNPNARDVLGTSVAAYANKFMNAVGPSQANAMPPALQEDLNARPMRMVIGGNQGQAVPRPAAVEQAPLPPPGQNFFDQFDEAPSIAQRSEMGAPPAHADALEAGLRTKARQMTTGAPASVPERILTDFTNQGIAAGQRTTPNMEAQSKNLISTDVYESEAGDVQFKDPATGQLVTTDQNKHVVLRDPADNRLKVFARTDNTNEGVLSSAGRLMMTGLGAGAPTARPGMPLAPVVKPLTEGQQVAQAAERIGVQVPRAVTTDSMAVQRAAAATRNIPLAGDPLVKGSERAISQLGTKASEVAQGYGTGSVAGSGDAAKGAIREYITGTTKARATKLYDAVDNLVDNSKVVPLTLTRGVAREIMTRRGNAAMGPDSKAIGLVAEAIERPGLTYSGLKDLRTSVGEMMKGGILPEGMSQAELKQIYTALTDDLKSTIAVAGGPKASAAFDRANNYYRLASERRAELAKIIGVDGNAPAEKVFDTLLAKASSSGRADISLLAKARKAMGADDWNEFTSGVVSRLGRDPAAVVGPDALSAVEFSPQRFLTAYGKLSPAGRDLLFRSGGNSGLASSLDDIAKVSSRFKELQKFSNPSGTSQGVAGAGIGAGAFAAPLTTLTSVVGGRILATALAKPSTAAAVAQWTVNYEKLVRNPTTPRYAMFQLSSRNLANNLNSIGGEVSVSDFLKAIQSPAKSAAEDEQNPVPRGPR